MPLIVNLPLFKKFENFKCPPATSFQPIFTPLFSPPDEHIENEISPQSILGDSIKVLNFPLIWSQEMVPSSATSENLRNKDQENKNIVRSFKFWAYLKPTSEYNFCAHLDWLWGRWVFHDQHRGLLAQEIESSLKLKI